MHGARVICLPSTPRTHARLVVDSTTTMARVACTTESTVDMQTWHVKDMQMWNVCRGLGVLDQFMSPAAEQRCKYGRAAREKLRRERRAHNAALIASAQEAAEEAAFTTSYGLRSQAGTSDRCSSLDGEALPSSTASKKRNRYEGVPQPTEEQVAAFAPRSLGKRTQHIYYTRQRDKCHRRATRPHHT